MAGKHTWFERLGHESYPIVRYLPDEQRTSVRQLEWMTAKHANALEARAALADELAAALQEAIGWLEHGIPESCGQCGSPNATCDMQCVEAAQYSQDMRHIRTMLAAYDAAVAAQDSAVKQES